MFCKYVEPRVEVTNFVINKCSFDSFRFEDLMNAIPLPDYTRRDGQWNLVSR